MYYNGKEGRKEVRLATGRLAAGKLERSDVKEAAVENVKIEFPATKLDVADQRTDVIQSKFSPKEQ